MLVHHVHDLLLHHVRDLLLHHVHDLLLQQYFTLESVHFFLFLLKAFIKQNHTVYI